MLHTRMAGPLRSEDIDLSVTLTGWVDRRHDHGGTAFIDLRDASKIVQVTTREEVVYEPRNEYCLQVVGVMCERPDGSAGAALSTGEIEMETADVVVLNPSAALSFQVSKHADEQMGEEARLKYRYLDLRRVPMQRAIRLRSEASQAARKVLYGHDFAEVETPTLTRSTPEGARDFLVSARLSPGSRYALPQSPQLFKQLLMVAGMERYYQIARCHRDEGFRADRQPKFTQLDIEMPSVDQDGVVAVAEDALRELWMFVGYDLEKPIPRITYADAMGRYGSDKPDLRLSLELVNLTEYFENTSLRVFQNSYVGVVAMPGGVSQPRRAFDKWQEQARARGAKGLAYVTIAEDGQFGGPVAKNVLETERAGLAEKVGAKSGDCVFFVAGSPIEAREPLGVARLKVGKRCGLIDPKAWTFTWVVDAPPFKPSGAVAVEGDVALGHSAWTTVHYAFTSPKPGCLNSFDVDPENALAYAYDIVCNENEIGGGSIHIHRRDAQEWVFKVMGISVVEAQEKFGFLLDTFKFGTPSCGGIAFGWDRIVSLPTDAPSTRDVIALPKIGVGRDPLTDAPVPIIAQQRKEAGVDARFRETDADEKPREAGGN